MSVYSTVVSYLKLRGFSWKHGISRFSRGSPQGIVVASQIIEGPDLPSPPTYTLEHGQPAPCRPSLLRHPIAVRAGIGILTDFPSTTAFALALGADSPCPDERWAGNLDLPAEGFFTPLVVTHVSIRTSDTSSAPHGPPSAAYRTLLYHACTEVHASTASVTDLAPVNLPRRPTRLVSYYAFFKGWLLLSQPPSCLCLPTSFPTEPVLGTLAGGLGCHPLDDGR